MKAQADPTGLLTRVGRLSVLFVMAAEAEYGPELRRVIRPLITGVGPSAQIPSPTAH